MILDLEPSILNSLDFVSTVTAIAIYTSYISKMYSLDNIILFEIGTKVSSDERSDTTLLESAIQAFHLVNPLCSIMILDSSQLLSTSSFSNFTYLNSKIYHGFSVQDIASDTYAADREKMYAHEKIACGFKVSNKYICT